MNNINLKKFFLSYNFLFFCLFFLTASRLPAATAYAAVAAGGAGVAAAVAAVAAGGASGTKPPL
jgi:hypothetical protein